MRIKDYHLKKIWPCPLRYPFIAEGNNTTGIEISLEKFILNLL